jgi:glycosyltransferase 2 family protein
LNQGLRLGFKLALGVGVSAFFIWLVLKDVKLGLVSESLVGKNYWLLVPAAATFIVCQIVKSIRWALLLSVRNLAEQRKIFPIACVGFMAIIVAPMRIGELVRPYLASAKAAIPMGSGFASILIERLLDLTVLLTFFFFVLSQIALPDSFAHSAILLVSVVAAEFAFIVALSIWPKGLLRILSPILVRLPDSVRRRTEAFILSLTEGCKMVSKVNRLVEVLILSLLVWGLSALAVYFLFLFCGFHFGLVQALAVTSITALGVSLPAAPGLIGNFQFGCIFALSLWGIPKTDAFTYSMVYYCLGVGINLLLGIIFIPTINIPLKSLITLKNQPL